MTAVDQAALDRSSLADQRAFLLASLRDLESERAAGDISDDDYVALRDDYTARAAAVLRAMESDRPAAGARPPRPPARVAPLRTLAWVSAVLVFAIVAGVLVARSSGDRVAGQSASGSIDQTGTDRLARARELYGSGKILEAVKTYDQVLKRDPKNVEALAYRGWLVRLAGLSDVGLTFEDRAVAADATYPDAHFFRGMMLWKDRHQPADGVAEFRLFLSNRPPQAMVPAVEAALQQALAESTGTTTTAKP
jgi:tetratricopeptide (TPR) repeat protein